MKENKDKVGASKEESEENKEHIPYPKHVLLILGNEFCERFNYYGMRAILSLYIRNELKFTERHAKIAFHAFSMTAYFFPLVGAVLADSFLGKYRTVWYISILYASGSLLLSMSTIKPLPLPPVEFGLFSLLLIGIGTGGIKPCVSTFGGDQFILPQQEKQLVAFFSMFYFSINVGSCLSTIITPALRKNVQCFDQNGCYPLAFGLPGFLMVIATVLFVVGKPFYRMVKPEFNIVLRVFKCIGYGIKQKCKSTEKVDHWLDRCEDKYGQRMVKDVKRTLKVFVMFIPIPMFWALFDQQASGWTFQASRMNGDIGAITLLPDQLQVLNSFMIVLLIPIFTYAIYPCLAKCNLLKTPLQRMSCGGMLGGLSFFIAAVLAFAVEAENPILPSESECQIRFYNLLNCHASITAKPYFEDLKVKPLGFTKIELKKVKGTKIVNYTIAGCDNINYSSGESFNVTGGSSILYYMSENFVRLEDDITKDENGYPKIRTIVDKPKAGFKISYFHKEVKVLDFASNDTSLYKIGPDTYRMNTFKEELTFKLGAVYTVLVTLNGNGKIQKTKIHEVVKPNSLHMLLQVPQYLIISVGEIMLSITGIEFSYSQAPISMKAVVSAVYLLTTAAGNLLVVIIESTGFIKREPTNFLVYGTLMILDMCLFIYLAVKYKYVTVEEEYEDYNAQ